jgi:hypothetical protein
MPVKTQPKQIRDKPGQQALPSTEELLPHQDELLNNRVIQQTQRLVHYSEPTTEEMVDASE